MASLNRLSIRGIRSFSPETEQEVVFKKPLTVICGQNGCGKTTIIECLKFACSGSIPPNTNSGQSFVHDPKMCNMTEVKAQIQLVFTARGKRKVLVQRNLRLLQKKTKMEFKQLEGLLKIKDPGQAQPASSSTRCAELDKVVPELMGVSKAVMENVLFCHQEDSSWPLLEASVLKKKFDDIFQSSRYAKALNEVKAQKKRMTDLTKKHEADKRVLDVHYQQSNKIGIELVDLDEDMRSNSEEKINLQELEKTLQNELNEIIANLDDVQDEKDKLTNLHITFKEKKSSYRRSAKSLQDAGVDITSIIQKDRETLERGNEEQEVEKLRVELDQLKQQTSEKQAELKSFREKLQSLQVEESRLDTQHTMQLNSCSDVLKHILKACKQPGMENDVENYTEQLARYQEQSDVIKDALNKPVEGRRDMPDQCEMIAANVRSAKAMLEGYIKQKELELRDMEKVAKKKIDELQQDLNEKQTSKSLSDEKISSLDQRLNDLGKKQNALDKRRNEILHMSNAQSINAIDKDLSDTKAKHDRLAGAMIPQEQHDEKLRALRLEQEKINGKIEQLQQETETLEAQQEDMIRFNSMVSEIRTEIDGLAQHYRNINDQMQYIQVESPPSEIARAKAALDTLRRIAPPTSLGHVEEILKSELGQGCETLSQAISDLKDTLNDMLERKNKEVSENEHETIKIKANSNEDLITKLNVELRSLQQIQLPDETQKLYEEGKLKSDEDMDHHLQTLETTRDTCTEKLEKEKTKHGMAETRLAFLNDKAFCPTCFHSFEEHNYPTNEEKARATEYSFFSTDVFDPATGMVNKTTHVEGHQTYTKGTVLHGKDYFVLYNHAAKVDRKKETRLEKLRLKLERARKDYNTLSSNLPKLKRRKVVQAELATLEKKHEMDTSRLAELQNQRVNLDNDVSMFQGALNYASKSEQAVGQLMNSMEQLEKRVEACKILASKLHLDIDDESVYNQSEGGNQKGPLDSARQEIRALQGEVQKLGEERDSLTQQRNTAQRELTQLERKVNELQQKRMDINESASLLKTIEDQQQELEEEKKKLVQDRSELRSKEQEIANASQHSRDTLNRESKKASASTKLLRDNISQLKEDMSLLSNYAKQVGQIDNTVARELLRNMEKIGNISQEIQNMTVKLKDLQGRANETEADLNQKQEALKRKAQILDLKDQHEQLQEMKSELKKLTDDVNKHGVLDELEKNRALKQNELTETQKKLAKLEGNLEMLDNRKRQLNQDLKNPDYVNIDHRHKEARIKYITTKMAAVDLDKYYNALDTALMQFHQLKIKQVNERLAELWPIMYKGGDIDKIELKSEKATTKRGNYNYRVVMTKGDIELDMRGRCSAGQKVLASLAIRMALADTFSVSCGILALDEPTTNLDDANRAGLAYGLAELLKYHRRSKGYQLIVITHDHQFVELLADHVRVAGIASDANYFTISRRIQPSTGKYASEIRPTEFQDA